MSTTTPSFDIWECLNRVEELAPELEDRLYMGILGAAIDHPLVQELLYTPRANALLNARLKAKQEAVETATTGMDWHRVVFLHERPHRLDAFRSIEQRLTNIEYWELLAEVWTDSENIWQNREQWITLLTSDRAHWRRIMGHSERSAYQKLPDVLTVYRGYNHEGGEEGLSWTLSEKVATWFSQRHARDAEDGTVLKGLVRKEHVIAHFTGRNEEEIVVLPEHVGNIQIVK